jgi:exodeoxyribonuclease VII large subunit
MMINNFIRNQKYWSVTELTRFIRELIDDSTELQELWVSGEISNVAHPSSGHLYFTLKDKTSSLRCVMWRNQVSKLLNIPKEGNSIEVYGSVSVYEAGGQYQFYATQIHLAGEGSLYKEFLELKERLQKEGLFDENRKKIIPKWPDCIGVITSPSGAALHDILNTINRRYPLTEVIISPSTVQGDAAPLSIKESIHKLNRLAEPDVIILARGGGSIEDLWAFNKELVARAISESEVPIICGVGHETDFTIADFASDFRAATPTAAAEIATPNLNELKINLIELQSQLTSGVKNIITLNYHQLSSAFNQISRENPRSRIESNIQKVDTLSNNLEIRIKNFLDTKKIKQSGLDQKLNAIAPDKIFKRGFSIVSKSNGQILKSINEVQLNERLSVQLHDGLLDVIIKSISPKNSAKRL